MDIVPRTPDFLELKPVRAAVRWKILTPDVTLIFEIALGLTVDGCVGDAIGTIEPFQYKGNGIARVDNQSEACRSCAAPADATNPLDFYPPQTAPNSLFKSP